MTSLRKFLLGLAIAFGVPWIVLIIRPALQAQKITPVAYDKERDGVEGVYPGKGIYRQGQLVYLREGCVQCHTQVIRPSFAGVIDGWKKGWGSDQSDTPHDPVRATTPRDFLGEPVAPLGVQRNGPDLTNVGYRYIDKDGKADRNALHVELFAPRALHPWSIMPRYRNLYTVRPVEGDRRSPKALNLPAGVVHNKNGREQEVIPTADAELLVDYLLSLKKDAPVPGQVVAESAPKK